MKYLCLGYLDQKEMDSRPQAEIDHIKGKVLVTDGPFAESKEMLGWRLEIHPVHYFKSW